MAKQHSQNKPWKDFRDKRISERNKKLDGGKSWEIIKLYKTGKRDFADSNLQSYSFVEANLQEINLSNSNLSGANLRRSLLQKANLEKANLQGADLREANLIDSILTGADLSNANLRGAKVTEAQLASASILEGAVLPSNIRGSKSPVDTDLRESPQDLTQELSKKSEPSIKMQEVIEGETYTSQVTRRKRNRTIISAKKADSDGMCEVCGFSFKKYYGLSGRDCLVAHHINPISSRDVPSKTTLDDIVLLCPNCHAIVHTQEPPISPKNLRQMLGKIEAV